MIVHQFLSACLLACALILICPVCGAQPTVYTNNGALLGITRVVQQGGSNLSVDIFYTIPYAKPPVGDLRFSKPVASEPWTGVRNAASPWGPWCPQQPIFSFEARYVGQEDCLYLNVYTPKIPKPPQGLPVMLFIHGGMFFQGSANEYDGAQLSANGVVVVVVNYRLGLLGFLSTQDNVSPGNYGLYDQLMALRWVRDNIQAFGGNPNDVTIFGESAGAACVSMLLLTPEAKGLFSKAIAESIPATLGLPTTQPQPLNVTKTLALKLGCPVDDHARLLACLRTKDAECITRTHMEIERENEMQITARPVVEGTFGQSGLLSDIPENLLKAGLFNKNVIVIRGFNKNEETIGKGFLDPNDKGFSLERFKNLTHEFVRQTVLRAYPRLGQQTVMDHVIKTYVTDPGVTDPKQLRDTYFEMLSDFNFLAHTHKETMLQYKATNGYYKIYLYRFSFRSANRIGPEWMGVAHADDIPYVFGLPLTTINNQPPFVTNWTDDDKTMTRRMMSLWTDFATHGNPTPNASASGPAWLPWTQATPQLYEINRQQSMVAAPETPGMRLWNDVIPNLAATSGSSAATGGRGGSREVVAGGAKIVKAGVKGPHRPLRGPGAVPWWKRN